MTDYSEIKQAAEAASKDGHHIYMNARDDGNWSENALFHILCTPDVVLALLKDLEVATSVGKALGVTLANVVESRDALVSALAALREDLEHARRQPLYSTRLAAERYRWLREQHWDKSPIAVVVNPKAAVKLGHECPSGIRLDQLLDSMRLVVGDD